MPFSNTALAIETLPAVEAVELEPVHPDYLRILRIEWRITSAVLFLIAAALLYFIPGIRNLWGYSALGGFALFFSLFYYILQEKSFPFRAYAIREKDVLYQKGWITRSLKVCPFRRIQNCSVVSGPLERKYGLATIVIYTGGSEGADMRIPGLQQEKAEKLRQFIVSQIHSEEDENL